MCVQAEGNGPLHRAYDKMKQDGVTPSEARTKKPEYMYAWENPHSIAYGILDDETYDWGQLVEGVHHTGGDVKLVSDEEIIKAKDVANNKFKVK